MARKGYAVALAALVATTLAGGASAQGYSLLTGHGLAAARDAVTPVAGSGSTPVPDSGLTPVPDSGLTPVPASGLMPVPASGLMPVPGSSSTPVPGSSSTPVPGSSSTPVPGDAAPPVSGPSDGWRVASLDPAIATAPRPGAGSAFGASGGGLIRARADIADTVAGEEALARGQSLFIGQAAQGFFAPFAPRMRGGAAGEPGTAQGPITSRYGPIRSNDPHAEMIRHIIAHAEAGAKGYDAVQYGARIKPGRPPTQMTLGEVFGWIKATPGQPHAIGRYQFIPSTLARLVTILDAGPNERFSPEMQDRLADILLQEAGLDRYRSGAMSRTAFMNNLAKIWAGLPNSSGRSHYHGYAGNAATMTWAGFEAEMSRIFQG